MLGVAILGSVSMLIRFFEVYYSRRSIMARVLRAVTGVNARNVQAVTLPVFRDYNPLRIIVRASGAGLNKIHVCVPVRLIHEFLVPNPMGPNLLEWRTVGGMWITGSRVGEYIVYTLLPPHGSRNERLLSYILEEAVQHGRPETPASEVWNPRKIARRN